VEAVTKEPRESAWRAELVALVRAASGGLLFGAPLLFTMEVWWTGRHTTPAQMLVVLGLLSVPVLALNRTTGFRRSRDVRLRDAVADTIEALAVGIVVSAVVLVCIREITVDMSLATALGKVVYETVPFCLGVGLARHFLHGGRNQSNDDEDGDGDDGSERGDSSAESGRRNLHPTLTDLGATIVGATFISLSIAPTDEVPLIASAMTPVWLLVLVLFTLLTCYGIVFVAEFHGQETRHTQEGLFQRPITETVMSYLVALAVAAMLLWLFQRGTRLSFDLLTRTVVLGFPAAVGGAAGRLAV
jgi:putative integral membrane protein (TIGR02587 family)